MLIFADINECDNATSHNCEQVCVNIPASFICDCYGGYQLNADRHRCDGKPLCILMQRFICRGITKIFQRNGEKGAGVVLC